ncbi:MAG: hypothetical protein IPK31_07635 [Chitinophagaceae bacterium]|nr:hypothetical protein [Chitinophagaceae bacterium]
MQNKKNHKTEISQTDEQRMIVQVQMQLTTVVSKLNQGIIPQSAVFDCGGPFCFFLDKQKEKKEQQTVFKEDS